jgi:hypothetical protein
VQNWNVVDETLEVLPIKGHETGQVCVDGPRLEDVTEEPPAPQPAQMSGRNLLLPDYID